MDSKKRVAGYVKLAKLWEKRREAAMSYHRQYYSEKYAGSDRFELAGVQELVRMVEKYISLNPGDFDRWKSKIMAGM